MAQAQHLGNILTRSLLMAAGGGLMASGVRAAGRSESLRAVVTVVGGGALLAAAWSPRTVGILSQHAPTRPVEFRHTITVHRSRRAVYDAWRDRVHLAGLMPHVRDVEIEDDGRTTHWTAEGPAGSEIRWTSVIDGDVPGRRIAWHGEGDFVHCGEIAFTDTADGTGTEVTLRVVWQAPLGASGMWAGGLLGHEPSREALEALRELKTRLERQPSMPPMASPTEEPWLNR